MPDNVTTEAIVTLSQSMREVTGVVRDLMARIAVIERRLAKLEAQREAE